MFNNSTFRAAWWLRNNHLQTMLAKYFRRKLTIKTVTQLLELPDDDFAELAWTELPCTMSNKPIVVLLHGLEGSVDSHYIKGMLQAIKARGWIGVLLHFRGCGRHINRQAQSYHSGHTKDIEFFSKYLEEHYPKNTKYLVGFSLGGNVVSKYLSTSNESYYKAASVICAPLHLASCSEKINRGFSKVYQHYLVNMLKNNALKKINKGLIQHISPSKLQNITTMWEFDEKFTAPLNNFDNAQDYYEKSSGLFGINDIKIPCLFVHAKDDPFLCHNNISNIKSLPKTVKFEMSNKGGHVGFIAGHNPLKPNFWLEQRIPDYLAEHL